jgi:hypothetical protein
MPSNVHLRAIAATPGPPADADDAAYLTATLADLADLQDQLDASHECSPCRCPGDGGRHLNNCHILVIEKLARQWTCSGSAGVPGSYYADCDCPHCRFEWTMGNVTSAINNLADAIREAGQEHSHSTLGETEELRRTRRQRGDSGSVDARWQRVVDALEAKGFRREVNEYGRAENKWQCPTHDDEHPSLSVNPAPDGSGKVLMYCHSGADCNGPEWLKEVMKVLN